MKTSQVQTNLVKKCIWLSSIIVFLLLLAYWLYAGWQQLAGYEWNINLIALLVSFVVRSAALVLSAIVWNSVLHRLGVRTGLRRNLKLYCYTSLIRRLPTALGFVAGRLYFYQKEGIAKTVTTTGMVLEAGLMVLSGMLVMVVTLPLYLSDLVQLQDLLPAVLIVPLALVAIRPWILMHLINFFLNRFGREPLEVSLEWRDTIGWIAFHSGIWLVGGFILFFLINAFSPLAFCHFGEVLGIWTITGLIGFVRFLLPIGVGLREVTLAYMLSSLVPMPVAVVISIASRLWLTLNDVFWVLLASRL